jgi:hypothetical protein
MLTLTRAITHIRLDDANSGKLAALDALVAEYFPLCQRYVHHFCTLGQAYQFTDPIFESVLSQRWQRVAIQQASGVAQSWVTNREKDYQHFLERQVDYEAFAPHARKSRKAPVWCEPSFPHLKQICIQANENVVAVRDEEDLPLKLQRAKQGNFDFWLQIATLQKYHPIYLPVKLAKYHREALASHQINHSVSLNRRQDGSWWLTLTFDEDVEPVKDIENYPPVAVDIGIANFITSSDGKRYGTFQEKLAQRHKQDREKRRRKAKLRACLEKKGIEKLPSTSSASGQRLSRHVKQSINHAVNEFFTDYPAQALVLERLNVSTMRFKSHPMNAYLYASQLGHIPDQLVWGAQKRGLPITFVKAAYSSQECHHCHYTDRANRTTQETFCCVVCGHHAHADENASRNLLNRMRDQELAGCHSREEIKVLLLKRHERWRSEQDTGYP